MTRVMPSLLLFASLLAACAPTSQEKTLTPLEIRAIQSRQYESGKDVVFPAMVSVFQDLGYTITNADKDTGLITAESASKSNAGSWAKFLLGMSRSLLGITEPTTAVSQQARATAFIEAVGARTQVRLNFVSVSRSSTGYGQSDREDTPILDAKIYENAFEMLDSAIFIRAQS